jgi:hypothetical protein
MGQLLSSLLSVFYTKKLEVVLVGLENRYFLGCIVQREEELLKKEAIVP